MQPKQAGLKALEHIDAALAKKPEKDGHILSAALQCLAEFRDEMVAGQRKEPEDRRREMIERINVVISCVMAAQYPLGDIPWAELQASRGWLVDALEDPSLSRGGAT